MYQEDSSKFTRVILGEYERLDKQWTQLHYHATVGIVLLVTLLEVFFNLNYHAAELGVSVFQLPSEGNLHIFLPSIANLALLLISVICWHRPGLRRMTKVYILSLLFVVNCFIFYSNNHQAFMPLIFFSPIILTVFYCNRALTGSVMMLSLALKLFSDMFLHWNHDPFGSPEARIALLRTLDSTLLLLTVQSMAWVIISFIKKKNDVVVRMEVDRLDMHRELLTDQLTGVGNRTALRIKLDEIERGTARSCHFAMVDLDHFKKINDVYGHAVGDKCLKELGDILASHSSDGVLAFRNGGDEFSLLFINKTKESVLEVCRSVMEQYSSRRGGKENMPRSLSIGIAEFKVGMFGEDLMKAADEALYRAKENRSSIAF